MLFGTHPYHIVQKSTNINEKEIVYSISTNEKEMVVRIE